MVSNETIGRVRSVRQAAAFVERVGVALVFPSKDLPLVSLWEAVTGTPEMRVFSADASDRKHLSSEIDQVWSLKRALAEQQLACLGKHVRGRLALISRPLLPAMYALCGREGRPDDFRLVPALSTLERRLCEAVLDAGPLTTLELRSLTGGDAKATKRAIDALQRKLILTQAGEEDQTQGWPSVVFDLLPRRYADSLRPLPSATQARQEIESKLRGFNPWP